MREFSLIVFAVSAVLLGCGAKTPVTEWYYSSWISERGMSSEINFKDARTSCLTQSGITDPAAVTIGGDQERRFIECMDAAGWCTMARGCD